MKTNYWRIKEEDLVKLANERNLGIDFTDISRKDLIDALKKSDLLSGNSDEVLMEGEDGRLAEIPAKMKLRKVRFHNTREDDVNYVFLGHNGRSFYVPKEQDVHVPQVLLDSCVNDAIETHMEPYKQDGRIMWRKKYVQRFPFSVLD